MAHPNKLGVKRGQRSVDDDELLKNYLRWHGHDGSCTLERCSDECRLRYDAQNYFGNKRTKPQTQNSYSKRPVQQVYRPSFQTSAGLAGGTGSGIFPRNPTSGVTIVPVPVPVPVAVPMYSPPPTAIHNPSPTMASSADLFPIIPQASSQAPPPAMENVAEQPDLTLSCELVAPELQFPDDITEVEPLVISPNDFPAPATDLDGGSALPFLRDDAGFH